MYDLTEEETTSHPAVITSGSDPELLDDTTNMLAAHTHHANMRLFSIFTTVAERVHIS